MRRAHDVARFQAVGAEISCPGCGATHTKRTYNHLFCSSEPGEPSCKDHYWNVVRPSERITSTGGSLSDIAERNALVGVLARAIQQQMVARVGGPEQLGTTKGKAPNVALDLDAVADAVIAWIRRV